MDHRISAQNQSRFSRPPSCSVCKAKNVQTRFCPCRKRFLRNIPFKLYPDGLRLDGSPASLVFDIVIGTDVVPVTIDTSINVSVVNQTMIDYLQFKNKLSNSDNTIDIDFKFEGAPHHINCIIKPGAEKLLTIGLSAILKMGMEFKLSESTIRGTFNNAVRSQFNSQNRNSSGPIRSYPRRRRSQYKYDNRHHKYHLNRRQEPMTVYPEFNGSENWDEPVDHLVQVPLPDVVENLNPEMQQNFDPSSYRFVQSRRNSSSDVSIPTVGEDDFTLEPISTSSSQTTSTPPKTNNVSSNTSAITNSSSSSATIDLFSSVAVASTVAPLTSTITVAPSSSSTIVIPSISSAITLPSTSSSISSISSIQENIRLTPALEDNLAEYETVSRGFRNINIENAMELDEEALLEEA